MMSRAGQLCADLGITPTTLISLVSPLLSIPCCLALRAIPNTSARHAFAAASGLLLALSAFGPTIWAHYAVLLAFAYSAMCLYRRRCGIVTLLGTFSYLVVCHVVYDSGSARKDQGIDFAGTLMMVTLKLTSAAFDYQDGQYLDDPAAAADAAEAAAAGKPIRGYARHLRALPSPLEFAGYMFCGGLHLTGPFFQARPYLEWANNEGLWGANARRPSFTVPLLTALAWALPSGLLHLTLKPRMDVRLVTDAVRFWRLPYAQRWGHAILSTYAVRTKIYYVWTVAEASMVASGLGFSGWVPAPGGGAAAAKGLKSGKVGKEGVARSAGVLRESGRVNKGDGAGEVIVARDVMSSGIVAKGLVANDESASGIVANNVTVHGIVATGIEANGACSRNIVANNVTVKGLFSNGIVVGSGVTRCGSAGENVASCVQRSFSSGNNSRQMTLSNVSVTGLFAKGVVTSNDEADNCPVNRCESNGCDAKENCGARGVYRRRPISKEAKGPTVATAAVQQQREGEKAQPTQLVASWERAKNIDIWGVEAVTSFHGYAKNWNTATGQWLRTYIYERVTPEGQKPGVLPLVLTVCTSAVWHGVYLGDFIFALSGAFLIMGSRIIHRFQKTIPSSARLLAALVSALHSVYAFLGLNYAAMGFIVLSAADTLTVFRGLGFLGTLMPLAVLAVAMLAQAVKGRGSGRRSGKPVRKAAVVADYAEEMKALKVKQCYEAVRGGERYPEMLKQE